jgi:hypothetical protein
LPGTNVAKDIDLQSGNLQFIAINDTDPG